MIYWFNELNTESLHKIVKCNEPPINVKKGKSPKYYIPLHCGFDIETTNLVDVKRAYMYIWQMSFDDNVIFGREWSEFATLIDTIKEVNELNERNHIIIWIANLSFEFQFLRKYFNITRIFAKEKRKPLYCEIDDCIELRDALPISGGNLEHLANNYTSTKKLVGDIDYKVIRSNRDKLEINELAYCRNDVVILAEWSKYIFDNYIIPHNYVPLTKTGILRRMVKQNAPKNISDIIIESAPTEKQYHSWMHWLFRGGYVHANAFWSDEVVEEVTSVDITSSYPDRMKNAYCPEKFYKCEWEESLLDTHCVVFRATFENLRATTNHSIESKSKVINDLKEFNTTIIDNGRVRFAEKVEVWLTELDYKIYDMYYEWDDMEVHECYCSKRIALPKYLLNVLDDEYVKKAMLKKNGKQDTTDYAVAKQRVNSAYGLLVTRQVMREITYENDEWSDDGGKDYDYLDQMSKTVLLPQWGIYVTAQARFKILSMIKSIIDNSGDSWRDDVLYCDTDSIKMVNYEKHKHLIDNYNEQMMLTNKAHGSEVFNDLGTFDYEGTYTRFKTLGAKRYAYEDGKGIHITVAGLPKRSVTTLEEQAKEKGLDFFELFKNKMTLEVGLSDKLTTCYNDEPHADYVNGVLMEEQSSVCLYDIPFKLKLADVYIALIKQYKEEGKYENRVY